ncbi:hypothetical protein A4R26_23720 [Niastella populi]|uniref:Uncharacterized protein n=1 Tax=Niastella populi TaxID=550983 RepID=A0A1V9FGQ0_9BACT|nr:hypothetical protein A4R26_23720 [Niastella populi]
MCAPAATIRGWAISPSSYTTKPADDVSKASALYTLKKIKTQLATAVSTNGETKANRANLLFLIQNALETK